MSRRFFEEFRVNRVSGIFGVFRSPLRKIGEWNAHERRNCELDLTQILLAARGGPSLFQRPRELRIPSEPEKWTVWSLWSLPHLSWGERGIGRRAKSENQDNFEVGERSRSLSSSMNSLTSLKSR